MAVRQMALLRIATEDTKKHGLKVHILWFDGDDAKSPVPEAEFKRAGLDIIGSRSGPWIDPLVLKYYIREFVERKPSIDIGSNRFLETIIKDRIPAGKHFVLFDVPKEKIIEACRSAISMTALLRTASGSVLKPVEVPVPAPIQVPVVLPRPKIQIPKPVRPARRTPPRDLSLIHI